MMDAARERLPGLLQMLKASDVDALLCTLPINILAVSGYWPVVGTSVALVLNDGRVMLIVPKDEEELARNSFAVRIYTFKPSPLDKITTAACAVREPLEGIFREAGLGEGNGSFRLGVDQGETSVPASYAAMHLYRADILNAISAVSPEAELAPTNVQLDRLRSIKTNAQLAKIRTACQLVETAFRKGASELKPGLTEFDAAALFRTPLSTAIPKFPGVERADGFVSCMSGRNSALAHGAYARSRSKHIEEHDLILTHCNSYADGYWTDITRTFVIGRPTDRQSAMYDAVFAARDAALRAIAPGKSASEVDHAARSVLESRGFGDNFKHSTGHGVGFSAIDPDALPRLHPKSPDVLEPGMVLNVEPAIYIQNFGGIRHCDMAAVTAHGAELLTPFFTRIEDMILSA